MKTDLQQGVNDKLAECYGGEGVKGLATAQLEDLPLQGHGDLLQPAVKDTRACFIA